MVSKPPVLHVFYVSDDFQPTKINDRNPRKSEKYV